MRLPPSAIPWVT